jgi:hypothetical protein
MGGEMAEQLEAIEREIYELAGRRFNIASLPQLRQVLFEELKLPVQRKTGITGEASTDQDTLEKLAPKHPLPRKILEHRAIAKLKGTYVDALPALGGRFANAWSTPLIEGSNSWMRRRKQPRSSRSRLPDRPSRHLNFRRCSIFLNS